jgi:hypothetical protein
MVQLTLFEVTARFFSVHPDTARSRQRVAVAIHSGDGSPGHILLDQWAAGLDAPALARAIRAEMTGAGASKPN